MIVIPKIKNKLVISSMSLLIILLIGYIDLITGYEFSLSFFYLIPIILLSLIRNVTFTQIILNALFAAIVWSYVYVNPNKIYSHYLIPYWEMFAILTIFLLVSALIFKLKSEHKKLLESNKKLLLLNEEKNNFLGIAAHDLRSPISGIYSFSNLLLTDKTINRDEHFQFIKIIKESSEKSLTLLSNLLDVSRIEAGILNLKLQPSNYIDYLNNCISNNKLIAKQKNIEIVFNSNNEEILVNIDKIYFEEVINNLISNAIKYSYANSIITIQISLQNDVVLTEIIDKGVGIPDDEIDLLFSPFSKSSSKPTQGESSTGLGLAIVKKILLLHNGNVGIKSELQKGTTVYFNIPRYL